MTQKIGILVAALALSIGGLMTVQAKKSSPLKIGAQAPDFTLQDTDGNKKSLSDYKGQYVVLEWVNHGCPFVVKHYKSGNMQKIQKDVKEDDVVWLSICSSAKGKQGYYSAKEWKEVAKEKGMASTAILLDPDGEVGKTYDAKTTPHMYIIDPEGALVYMGAIDDKPTTDTDDIKGAHNYVLSALQEHHEGEEVSESSTKPYGCSVKYK
jgi:peroxiredoxin